LRRRFVLFAGLLVLSGCGGADPAVTTSLRPASTVAASTSSAAPQKAHSTHAKNAPHQMDDMAEMTTATAVAAPHPTTHGFRLNLPLPRPDFVLTDTRGRRYDFAARTRGRATLLYFGYTNCPYQCPTAMADVAVALRKLPRATRNKVTVVFVTTDPERDSAAAIRSWLKYFSAPIIGLTGTRAEVEAAQTAAQVTIARPKPKEKAPAGPASTAHGGGILAYGSDNYAHVTYPAGTSSADLVHDLPGLTRAGH
jgi:protein SCO1/2